MKLYTTCMNQKDKTKLIVSYNNFQKKNVGKKGILQFLLTFMPEIILRTTRLEGESITKKWSLHFLGND